MKAGRYCNRAAALAAARQANRRHPGHKAIETHYWSMDRRKVIPCWTVVYQPTTARKGAA